MAQLGKRFSYREQASLLTASALTATVFFPDGAAAKGVHKQADFLLSSL
jgi:hypothetical protein